MSLLQETHSQYATFSDNVKCGSIDVADLVVTNSASIEGIDVTTTVDNTKVGVGAGGLANFQNVSVGSDAGAALASSGNVVVSYSAVKHMRQKLRARQVKDDGNAAIVAKTEKR